MTQCNHKFKKNSEGEVLCELCGDKDDEMVAQEQPDTKEPEDFWATQSTFE